MSNDYKGWKLFDKITIVARQMQKWDPDKHEYYWTEEYQGFIVDPSNKKQLESARKWGTTYRYDYNVTDENGRVGVRTVEEKAPEEYTYNNNNFILELSEAAEQSSQGGKLSFWNCWITAPDGKRFLVGIAANLLLDLLKSTTVINGKVQAPLMFARCKGGVGMLSADTQSYKDAVNDEALKKNKSTGKTTKHKVGYVYETLTQKDVYLGDVYQWYEPIYEEKETNYRPYHPAKQLVGFRKLSEPKRLMWFTSYYDEKDADFYVRNFRSYQLEEKLPARKESIVLTKLPTVAQAISHLENEISREYTEYIEQKKRGFYYIDESSVGLSDNSKEYTLPQVVRSYILALNLRVDD